MKRWERVLLIICLLGLAVLAWTAWPGSGLGQPIVTVAAPAAAVATPAAGSQPSVNALGQCLDPVTQAYTSSACHGIYGSVPAGDQP